MMQKKKTKKKVAFSIRNKILVLLSVSTLPFLLVSVYLLVTIARYNRTYNDIVDHLTIANNYNISFKEEMDESLYKIVVGYVSIDTISQDETLKNPYIMIRSLRSSCTELKKVTEDYESRLWLDSLLRNTDTLEKRVTDILENVHEGNQYDTNISELDNNIYIMTELIQDDIQYYIYYQTNNMETVTNVMNAQVRAFIILLSVLLCVLGVAVAVAAFLVTSGILRPLWQLYDATGEIAEGNFAVRTNAKTSDEVAVLSQGFNDMAGKMQELVDKVRDDEQKMRKADLRLLQEQINPHFLYNTLESIYCLAQNLEDQRIAVMTNALGKLLRSSLNDKRDVITVSEDLQVTRDYLSIQQIRYGERLQVEYDFPQDILTCRIPAMTIQPLVENAIHHAAEKMLDVCVIRVSGAATADGVDIIVQDNGPGTDEDILNKLESGEVQPEGLGIGMRNIHKRVQHAFSEQYGLRVCSEEGQTQIIVHLPDTRPEPHNKA